jgi:hypothetical protein
MVGASGVVTIEVWSIEMGESFERIQEAVQQKRVLTGCVWRTRRRDQLPRDRNHEQGCGGVVIALDSGILNHARQNLKI